MTKVIIESPYAGNFSCGIKWIDKIVNYFIILQNKRYARKCMHDCFSRSEAPYASHLLYTQPGILNDNNYIERKKGIEAGFVWRKGATVIAVYTDKGISKGMKQGIARALLEGRKIEYRKLRR